MARRTECARCGKCIPQGREIGIAIWVGPSNEDEGPNFDIDTECATVLGITGKPGNWHLPQAAAKKLLFGQGK